MILGIHGSFRECTGSRNLEDMGFPGLILDRPGCQPYKLPCSALNGACRPEGSEQKVRVFAVLRPSRDAEMLRRLSKNITIG